MRPVELKQGLDQSHKFDAFSVILDDQVVQVRVRDITREGTDRMNMTVLSAQHRDLRAIILGVLMKKIRCQGRLSTPYISVKLDTIPNWVPEEYSLEYAGKMLNHSPVIYRFFVQPRACECSQTKHDNPTSALTSRA